MEYIFKEGDFVEVVIGNYAGLRGTVISTQYDGEVTDVVVRTEACQDICVISDYLAVVHSSYSYSGQLFANQIDSNLSNIGKNCDSVNHPKYYNSNPSGVECIDIVRHMNFNIGNAVKYLFRNGLKHEEGKDDKIKQIEDLQKAIFYINDEIKRLQNN